LDSQACSWAVNCPFDVGFFVAATFFAGSAPRWTCLTAFRSKTMSAPWAVRNWTTFEVGVKPTRSP
jgi:hypothetical protein